MSTPNILLIGNISGLVTLDDTSFSTDEDGVSRAVARFVCYPPNPAFRPARNAAHPRYPNLRCISADVRTDVFMFITATYVGMLDGDVSTEEAESHIRTGWWLGQNEDGSMAYKKYAIKNTVQRRHVTTTGSAPSSSEDQAVSYRKIGNLTRYTIETTSETREEIEE